MPGRGFAERPIFEARLPQNFPRAEGNRMLIPPIYSRFAIETLTVLEKVISGHPVEMRSVYRGQLGITNTLALETQGEISTETARDPEGMMGKVEELLVRSYLIKGVIAPRVYDDVRAGLLPNSREQSHGLEEYYIRQNAESIFFPQPKPPAF